LGTLVSERISRRDVTGRKHPGALPDPVGRQVLPPSALVRQWAEKNRPTATGGSSGPTSETEGRKVRSTFGKSERKGIKVPGPWGSLQSLNSVNNSRSLRFPYRASPHTVVACLVIRIC